MAEKNPISQDDATSSESSENLSNDEWTIIGENCYRQDDTDDETNVTSRIEEIQESALSMKVINAPSEDATDDETGSVIVDKQAEDSDGISVITESEAEQLVVNKKFGEINGCKNQICSVLKTDVNQGEKTTPQVGTVLNVVIACSLAAIIGLGAGRILGMDDQCPVTSAADFSTIKMESDVLINQIKELSEVKDVLDEIKACIPEARRAHKEISQRESKWNRRSERSEDLDKPSKISDTYIFDPDTTILEQLQTSLNTLCSVIDGINPENDFIKLDTPKTRSVVEDLIEFKKIIHNVVKEIGDVERPKEMEFLRNADKRIRDVCKSLLRDLSYTVNGLTMKIHHKLNKVRQKLNRRLCLLKNSESTDRQIFKSLDENNSFLQSCDDILNVTFNPSQRSMKPKKKMLKSYKVYPKTSDRKSSESEDDNYPTDSSSESSLPDLTYSPVNGEVWDRKKVPRQVRNKAKGKVGKILSENAARCRKFKNSKSLRSSGERSFRKLMMEVLVPQKSCPLTREHWLAADSQHRESWRLEVERLKRKPLYSTILKSEQDFPGNWTAEKTQGVVDAEAIERRDEKSRVEVAKGKEKAADTKHTVTPAESGMDVATVKSIKEERNEKIRRPVVKHNRVLREKQDQQGDENSESSKHCRKGKKCTKNPEPKKQPDTIKRETTSSETTTKKKYQKRRNNEEKKQRKSRISDEKPDKGFKRLNHNQNMNIQLAADWQLQRSRAREMHRNSDHRSEWFFDRADSRQDARKNTDSKSRITEKCYRGEKCGPIPDDPTHDEESFFDYRWERREMNGQHSAGSRAGFTAKKEIKMPHRKNILQYKRR